MEHFSTQLWHSMGISFVLCEEYSSVASHRGQCVPGATCSTLVEEILQPQVPQRVAPVRTAPVEQSASGGDLPSTQMHAIKHSFSVCLDRWDPILRSYVEKLQPAPLLWTYHELAVDLFEKPSQERRNILQYLFSALKLPQGSNVFFPCTLPATAMPCHTEFTEAMHVLSPKIIVAFGIQSIASIRELQAPSIWQEMLFYNHIRILFLPAFTELHSADKIEQCARFLTNYIATIYLS